MNQTYNIVFSGKVESYFKQLFLAPITIILGAFLGLYLNNTYGVSFEIALFVFFIISYAANRLHVKFRPFFCFSAGKYGSDETKITVGHGNKKISGTLSKVIQSSEFLTFHTLSKAREYEVAIPLTILGEQTFETLANTLLSIKNSNFVDLRVAFDRIGIRAEIKKEGGKYINLQAGTSPSYVFTSLILLILAYVISACMFLNLKM